MNPADDSGASFQAFCARVREEPALFAQLETFLEIKGMAAKAAELGRTLGFVFTPAQVHDAWLAACQSRPERRPP